MDEKKKLKIVEKIDEEFNTVEEKIKPEISHPNQTNPIYKKLMTFKNSKIGEKLSVKDLLKG